MEVYILESLSKDSMFLASKYSLSTRISFKFIDLGLIYFQHILSTQMIKGIKRNYAFYFFKILHFKSLEIGK